MLTISSWVCFSATKSDSLDDILNKKKYYRRTPKIELKRYDYLNNVEVIHKDASDPEKFINYINSIKQNENVIYILDPPYLYTESSGYTNYKKEYFDLKQTSICFIGSFKKYHVYSLHLLNRD